MKELFKKMFAEQGLDEDTINKFYLEFASIVLVTLVGISKDKLNATEVAQVPKMIENKKIEDIFNLIQSKYSPEEWQKMITEHITPICESYVEEVVLPVTV